MGYLGIGLIIFVITIFIFSFVLISHFKEIMEWMKENEFGYNDGHYSQFDNRFIWVIVSVVIMGVLSLFAWPLIVIVETVGVLYFIIRKEDKLKRIVAILKEKDPK